MLTVTMRWKHQTSGRVWPAPAVVDGIVYGGSNDRTIFALANAQIPVVLRDIQLRGAPSESGVVRGAVTAGESIGGFGDNETRGGVVWLEITVGDLTGWVPADAVDAGYAAPVGEVEYVYRP